MRPEDWHEPQRRCLGLMLAGEGSTLALLLNAAEGVQEFALPDGAWQLLVDTAEPDRSGPVAGPLPLAGRSVVLLRSGPP